MKKIIVRTSSRRWATNNEQLSFCYIPNLKYFREVCASLKCWGFKFRAISRLRSPGHPVNYVILLSDTVSEAYLGYWEVERIKVKREGGAILTTRLEFLEAHLRKRP